MKTCVNLISFTIFGFLGVGSLFTARTRPTQGATAALTGSRIAVTRGPADRALIKVGGPDRLVELAQKTDPRIPRPTGQTSTKKKVLNPRTGLPLPGTIHG